MKYQVVPSYVWTYPDVTDYPEGKQKAEMLALRQGFCAFQVQFSNICGDEIALSLEGLFGELYRLLAIPVESCPGIETPLPHFPERKAPFKVNDCLIPMENGEKIKVEEESVTLYVCVKVDKDAEGILKGSVVARDRESEARVPVEIEVSKACLPEERLNMVMGFNPWDIKALHDPESVEEFRAIEKQYFSLLRRQHQNMIYVRWPWEKYEDGKWSFDFRHFNRYVKTAMEMGFKKFLVEGVGFRRAWDAPDILHRGIDLLSREGYEYLRQYLTALRENLIENGWLSGDLFMLGICDEPNDVNALSYRAVASVARKYIPEIKLYDATSGAPIYGALDIWVPRADEYEANREVFDSYREAGDEVWHYVCLYPREGGYINRFMDIPLLSTRYLFWGNYKYGLTGYLHWTVNAYQNGCNPFEVSCPRHVNAGNESILPPGDDKLIYPGKKEGWMSMRLENHRESAEEYSMLVTVAEKDKALADAICDSVFESFHSVEFDAEKFESARRKLIRAYEKMKNEE